MIILQTIIIGLGFFALGLSLGMKRGKRTGYDTGYRDGRISCARNKRVATTHLKAAEPVKSRKLEEESVEWLG